MALQLLLEIDIQMGSLLNVLQTIKLLFEIWESSGDTAVVNSSLPFIHPLIQSIIFSIIPG